MARTLFLGLGNSILTDDSVGLRVVRELGERILDKDLHVLEACFANIDLLNVVGSYERLVIIDSIKTEGGVPGELYEMTLKDLQSTLHLSCPHDINLATAFELGQRLGMALPKEVQIYAIEVEDTQTVSETCSASVERAIPQIVEQLVRLEGLS